MFIVFDRDISLFLRTREISLPKNNSHDLHRVITHSLVLAIISKWDELKDEMTDFISGDMEIDLSSKSVGELWS